ncbi:DUF397 domain-containing protein [Spirillospora sp. NBC_00431]
MPKADLGRVVFRKSSYSEGANGCVEAAALGPMRLVRDTKNPQGGHLTLGQDAWAALMLQIKQGAYDV